MTGLGDVIKAFGKLLNSSVKLLIAAALLVFLFGLVRFIFNLSGKEGNAKEGRNLMLWGIIALFVMVSIWGIVSFLQGEFGFRPNNLLLQLRYP